MTGRWLI